MSLPWRRLIPVTAAAFALFCLSPTVDAAQFNPPKHYYLALGDSLAFGLQFGKFFSELAMGTYDPASFNTGYVDDFASHMRSIDLGLETVNLACPGETTGSFDGTCLFKSFGIPLHTNYSGSQMSAALSFLHAHPGQVSPITIDLGFNDWALPCAGPTFLIDVACLHTTMAAALASVAQNLPTILFKLRQASPSSEIIVMTFYNPFYVQDPSTDALMTSLNEELAVIAAHANAQIADTFKPFNRTGDETSTVCSLTLMCPGLDPHASDAGYGVMAQQFWTASGYSRLSS